MAIRRDRVLRRLSALGLLLGCWPLRADPQFLGSEFQVNTFTTSLQTSRYAQKVAADDSGNFVVVWSSAFHDGSDSGIFGQRFDSAGNPTGSEFQVNTHTTGNQYRPAVAVDGAGNFVVTWQDNLLDGDAGGIFGQWFDSSGNPAGSELQLNNFTTSSQIWPRAAAAGAGSFVVVWSSSSQDGPDFGVFGQRFDSTGVELGSEFPVNSYTTSNQLVGAVGADNAGNFVVVWNSYGPDGSYFGVFGQQFDSAGNSVGSEFPVNSYTTGQQFSNAVAVDGSGHFVVVWESNDGDDGDSYGVFAQRFDSTGSKVGSELQVNSFTTGSQRVPSVAADGSGNFVVVWYSTGQDGDAEGVMGQRYDAANRPLGSEFQVNSYTTNNQSFPSVAADGAGNFVVIWESYGQDGSNNGLFGQRLAALLFGGSAGGFESGDVCDWSSAVGAGSCLP